MPQLEENMFFVLYYFIFNYIDFKSVLYDSWQVLLYFSIASLLSIIFPNSYFIGSLLTH